MEPDAGPATASSSAFQTPAKKRRVATVDQEVAPALHGSESGQQVTPARPAVDDPGSGKVDGLSLESALRLARSCRRSPACSVGLLDTPRSAIASPGLEESTGLSQAIAEHISAEEERLLAKVAIRSAAEEELRWLQLGLYPTWADESQREAHLEVLLQKKEQHASLRVIAHKPSMGFARRFLSKRLTPGGPMSCSDGSGASGETLPCGLANLGNTCYLNAVTHCLFHCWPFRQDIESQSHGTFLGQRLKALLEVYARSDATSDDIVQPLVCISCFQMVAA